MSWVPKIRNVFLVVAAFSLFVGLFSPPALAHSMALGQTRTINVCLDPLGYSQAWLFDDLGPADRTWVFEVFIWLSGGDRYFDSTFSFDAWDNALGYDVTDYGAPTHDWIIPNVITWSGTMTAHIGGTVDLVVTLSSSDSSPQCLDVYAEAWYYA